MKISESANLKQLWQIEFFVIWIYRMEEHMKVTKFETNQKRDLFMHQTKESASKYKDNIEYSVLNV